MKHRFNKLLASVLSAALCVPTLPAKTAYAAGTDADAAIVWTDPETVPVTQIREGERFINFNENWKFYFGDSSTAQNPSFIDSAWEDISLPHDFSIMQDFTAEGEAESGFLPGGTGWYRKKFSLPESFEGKSIVLNFDGVYKDAEVYVNGEKLGEHHYGYTPFAFDISGELVYDGLTENVIAVKAVNNLPSSRWYSGSGIYRDVTLIVADPVHVDVNGAFVTTPNLASSNGSDGTASIAVDVKNDGDAAANITVKNTIYEKGGETPVATASDMTAGIAAGETKTITATASVSNPKLWSIETPNLYMARTEIVQNGQTIDTYETEFGYKWYEFADNTGFKLNGENVKINGVCMHHDQGALGAAAYYDAIYRQMSIMKDMGVNTIRITHNPGAEILVDICSELGLLVIEEFFDGWMAPKNGNSNDFSVYFERNMTADNQVIGGDPSMTWAEFTLKSIVKRDRSDASMILWSLCNEVNEGTSRGDGEDWKTTANRLINWTKEMDTTHPVTSGSNRRGLCASDTSTEVTAVNHAVYQAGGVPGFNYGDINSMNTLHGRYPVMLWSETASAINSRGIYTTQASGGLDSNFHLTSYDKSCVGWGKTAHASMYPTLRNDWIAGECVWTGFDYIGEPTPLNGTGTGDGGRGAIPNSSYFGIVETSGFPKDNFYLYRSQWNQNEGANTLHLVTAWDPKNQMITDGKTPVWIYSNAPKVELFLNGDKIGTATRKALNGTTTAAGHVHYEYTTESNNANICATSSGNGDESLYSVFNVAFSAGTISAKAYDESGAEITNSCAGTHSISTPGNAAKLVIPEDYPKNIDADGKSLAYITVDVKDANGNLKTTANNTINFSLTGNGEIVGVDNGDQATVDKYQQKSVLTSAASAKIKAYAGKALVIVRSTKKNGSFTLTATSEGLTSASATVQTKDVRDPSEPVSIDHYTMSKHLYLPIGSDASKIRLPETVTATMTDFTEQTFHVSWNDIDASNLSQKGIYEVYGSATKDGQKAPVSILLHVYKEIVGVQNHAAVTGPNVMPSLPTVSMAYDADGEAFAEYPVTWNTQGITTDSFETVGDIVPITGTVSVFGKEYTANTTVRVVEPSTVYENVGPTRDHLTDNGLENGSKTENGVKKYDDNLNALTNKGRADGSGSDHWSDWGHRTSTTAQDNLKIAMDWATAILTDHIDIYFSKTGGTGDQGNAISDNPTSVTVKIEYATTSNYSEETGMLESNAWQELECTGPVSVPSGDNAIVGQRYQFDEINPQALRFTFGHAARRFIALTEIEVMSPSSTTYESNSDAALTGVSIGGETIEFDQPDGNLYLTLADSLNIEDITFENAENAAVTLLQLDETHVKIVSSSEDGSITKTYTITNGIRARLPVILQSYKALNAKYYNENTENTFQDLRQLVTETENNFDDLTDAELKTKKASLETAYQAMVTESLQIKSDAYKKLESWHYTPESYQALKDLLDDLGLIDDMTVEARNTALKALVDAYDALEGDEPEKETKEELQNKLSDYKALPSKFYTDKASWQSLQDLITETEEHIDSLSQSQLEAKLDELDQAFNTLETKKVTDYPTEKTKSDLQEKLKDYGALDSSIYTTESYQTLMDLMDGIAETIHTLLESELQQKLTDLSNAYNDLKFDRENVHQELNTYEQLDPADYTPESFQTLQNLITELKEQLGTLSETELKDKLSALADAVENLAPDEAKPETKESMQEKLNACKDLPAATYTKDSYDKLQKLMNEIEANIDKWPETTLQAKLSELETARNALVTVAKNNLLTQAKTYRNLKKSLYTATSYSKLNTLLVDIEKNSGAWSDSVCKTKLDALKKAYGGLATVATYNSLQSKLNAYSKLVKTDYTATSWNALNTLITQIKSKINTYSETQLKAQITALDRTRNALKAAPKIDTATFKDVQYKILSEKTKTATAFKLAKPKASKITIQANVKINGVSYKVTDISPNAFSKASKLKDVTIGKNIKTIGKNAFSQCRKLNKVTFKGSSAPKISGGAFKKTASKMTVKVPKKLKKSSFKKNLTKAGMSKKLTLK